MEASRGEPFPERSRGALVQPASPHAPCFWCERLHAAEHPLAVCPACSARFWTIRALEMSGSYPLSDEAIDAALTRISAGNYALGYLEDDAFRVFYVGRSDSDVRRRLHEWVDMPSGYARYAPTGRAAWALRHRGGLPPGWGGPALGHVGSSDSSYTRFAFSYAPSAAAAFAKECRNYDDFGGSDALDNADGPVATPDESP